MSPYLFQSPFPSQLFLGLLEDSVIDDLVQGHFFIHEAVADVFIQHELDAVHGHGKIRSKTAGIKIVGLAYRFRVALEASIEARLDRLLFISPREMDAQHQRL